MSDDICKCGLGSWDKVHDGGHTFISRNAVLPKVLQREASKMEIHYTGSEWAALYVDGKLVDVGDAYLAEEEAFRRLGVKQVYDDSFMRGQTQREGVAKTLEEVEEYKTLRTERQRKADELRAEAARLAKEADELEKQ